MEEKIRAKNRPGQYFSVKQKHTIIQAYLSGGKSNSRSGKNLQEIIKKKVNF